MQPAEDLGHLQEKKCFKLLLFLGSDFLKVQKASCPLTAGRASWVDKSMQGRRTDL